MQLKYITGLLKQATLKLMRENDPIPRRNIFALFPRRAHT